MTMFRKSICAATFVLAASLMAALPARAAVQLEPGLWQDVEIAKDNGKTAKPEVHTTCLSPEEARDPIKTITKDADGQKCDTLNVKENGTTVTVEMKCGDPKTLRMEIDMIVKFISTRHYTGTMKSRVVFKGITSTSEGTIESTWLAAACKK
jgi:hypothetical protein